MNDIAAAIVLSSGLVSLVFFLAILWEGFKNLYRKRRGRS